LYGYGFLRRG